MGNFNLLNLASNDYLGLLNQPELIQATQDAIQKWGLGMATPRMLGGTQKIHKDLEAKLSEFFVTEESLLFSSAYHANIGLFDALVSEEDYVICDSFIHPSILEGVRLSRAKHYFYSRSDMNDLEDKLKRSPKARFRLIVTEGVFSVDGTVSNLESICSLAQKYDALVVVHDSHGAGVMGENGKGSHEFRGVMDQVHLLTGTLSHALGGVGGGYVSGKKEIVSWLRQRCKSFLFTTAIAPHVVATSLRALEIITMSPNRIKKLQSNTAYFRKNINALGFRVIKGEHPIVPIVLNNAIDTQKMTNGLFQKGIYMIGFCYPVVPKGFARIRAQVSAGHSEKDLDEAVGAFREVGKSLKLI